MPEIQINGLCKYYGEKAAVHDVTFMAEEGKLTTLLGPSGSGKSTTVRLIAGLEQPDRGEIWLGKECVYRDGKGSLIPTERRNIGMVFQSYALWPHKTVADNIALPLKVRHLPKNDIRQRIREVLAIVNLESYENRYPGQLSGGEQQRVALARALVYHPRILLLDEPLANLDALIRERVRFELLEIQRRVRITTLYVTHDQAEAMVISDLVIIMNKGQIVQTGSPREVFDNPRSAFVANFLGVNNLIQAIVSGTGRAVLSDGREVCWSVESDQALHPRQGNKVFLSIRPHQILLGSNPSSGQSNQFEGKVVKRAYVGMFTEYWIESGSLTLRVQNQLNDGPSIGNTVHFTLEPRQLRVLPEEREKESFRKGA